MYRPFIFIVVTNEISFKSNNLLMIMIFLSHFPFGLKVFFLSNFFLTNNLYHFNSSSVLIAYLLSLVGNSYFFFLIITLGYWYALLTCHNLPSNDLTSSTLYVNFYNSMFPLLSLFYNHIILLFAPTYVVKSAIVKQTF